MKSSEELKPRAIQIRPVTPNRWPDVEKLFGPRGACAGCWCMYWRLAHSQYKQQQGLKNKRAFRKIVESGATPGLLAYTNGQPVGWCAVAPRDAFPRLENSRTLARIDDQPVWSVVCFFIAPGFRHRGVSLALLRGAVEYARKRGAKIIEGYPIAAKTNRMADAFAWTGLESVFRKAGFKELARRALTRPLMRFYLQNSRILDASLPIKIQVMHDRNISRVASF
jgi:GNAT superfamily N-acetyltransferase